MPSILLASGGPLGHVLDHGSPLSSAGWVGEIGFGTIHQTMLIVSGVTLLAAMFLAASRIRTGPESEGNARYVTKGRISQIIEVMTLYLRDEMLVPVLGEKQARRWLPFLLSLFFLILTINLYGLVPLQDLQALLGLYHEHDGHKQFYVGGTSTASISVTAAFALCAFLAIQIHSFRELGFLGWLDHLTCGLMKGPKGLLLVVPIVFAVEFAGVFIKPVALAIRLFANMMGGHILLATVIMLPTLMGLEGGAFYLVSLGTGAFAVALTFMELFVAFLQAFVFMFLTAVFLSLMSHEEHEHEDHAAEEVAHAH